MAEFAPNKPVASAAPVVIVDQGLPLGIHVFQLQVQDDLGQVSEAVSVSVSIEKSSLFGFPGGLTPIIPPIIPGGILNPK
ncbi:MAG: hypothetical protein QOJ02_4234 [Acidobacteriota bacterium]|jgi:hypothetical protein|nr:hypothetical protein [Acidobacteriota bacterium]